jgi:hypothetical protein
MLYSLFLIGFGIFLGQEYTVIPSIKIAVISTLDYIKQVQDTPQPQAQPEFTNYINLFKNYFNKQD